MRLFDEDGLILFDSALGTALLAAGQPKGTGSEEMNEISPDTVLGIHLENVKAGSDVISSNSFGVSQMMFRGERERALALLEKSVVLAIDAASGGHGGRDVFACLSVGPTGAMLGSSGDTGYDDVRDIYAAQAEAGERAGADFILLETFADPEEFVCAARAARSASGLPVAGTMTFDENGYSFMGGSAYDLLSIARDEKLIATGANCTLDPFGMQSVIDTLTSLADGMPIIAQPNMGQPVIRDGKAVYETPDEVFLAGAEKLIDLGISGIGGCCGTTPVVISSIRAMIDRR